MHRIKGTLAFVLLAFGCAQQRTAKVPPANQSPNAEGSAPTAAVAQPASTHAAITAETVGLPRVRFQPGPLRVRHYPSTLALGIRDYAQVMGYSKDEKTVIACGPMAPLNAKGTELGNVCFANEQGKTRSVRLSDGQDGTAYVGKDLATVLQILKEGHPQALRATETTITPPAITGEWKYGGDIALDIDDVPDAAVLRAGGSVGDEAAVFPILLQAPVRRELPYRGAWNGIVQNPSRTELAFVAHFTCMEWCTDVVVERRTHDEIASLVFNDTGFRHHQKGSFAAARDLFLKAVWANPAAALPAYNLACAYGRLGDNENTEKALRLTLAVAGEKAEEWRTAARIDFDFKAMKNESWFRTLTATPR